jgi:hypothetical protein
MYFLASMAVRHVIAQASRSLQAAAFEQCPGCIADVDEGECKVANGDAIREIKLRRCSGPNPAWQPLLIMTGAVCRFP